MGKQQDGAAVFPPGCAIGLAPPRGCRASHAFPGFMDKASLLIMVESWPSAGASMSAELQRRVGLDALARERFTETQRWQVRKPGWGGWVMHGRQEVNAMRSSRWMLVVAGQDFEGLVTVMWPRHPASARIKQKIRAALDSVVVAVLPPVDDAPEPPGRATPSRCATS